MAVTTTYEIHPAIGIARLGRSEEYFLGPEPDGVFPPPRVNVGPGAFRSFRDAAGELRPQAARFRVFECQRDGGTLVSAREVTSAEAVVTWRVHVVNSKGAAPKFVDPATQRQNVNPAVRRNNAQNSEDLANPINQPLIINPGRQDVSSDQSLTVKRLEGSFKGVQVTLGRIFTEATGRLVFVGGTGQAGSVPAGVALQSFADSDDWYDDTCDGSVEAEIAFNADGHRETAKPAWLISGPFDFAPEIENLVTLYDLLFDLAVDRGLMFASAPVFFDRDILPILARVVNYQWVSDHARKKHGKGKSFEFTAPAWGDLGDPASASGKLKRQKLLDHLRPPGDSTAPLEPEMPPIFSDNYPDDPSVMWLTKVQYGRMKAWASDQFVQTAPASAELLPDALTRMALQSCVGRALWPGIEVGVAITDPAVYAPDEPFRIAVPGPIQPGMLTRSMALPWQSDFLACAWEDSSPGRAWWPAQRPDEVLPEINPSTSESWARGISGRADLIARWHRLGVVRLTASGDYLETERIV